MTIDPDLLRRYAAELDRIGISDEASRYLAVDGSPEGAISELRQVPTGLGTDGFFRMIHGVDFETWRRNLEAEIAAHEPRSNEEL